MPPPLAEEAPPHVDVDNFIAAKLAAETVAERTYRNINDVIQSYNSNNQEPDRKIKDMSVPVFNTLMVKDILEDDGHLYLRSTMIQNVFGLSGSQKDKETPFAYRFNDRATKKDDPEIDLRRVEQHSLDIQVNGDIIPAPLTSFTFNTMIPLSKTLIIDHFPFTVHRATATVELCTRTDDDGLNIRLRPNLMLHPERRNNISLQQPMVPLAEDEHLRKTQTQKQYHAKLDEDLMNKLDRMGTYDLLTPYPEIKYLAQPGKNYCPQFKVSFLLLEEGMSKFISVQLPMIFIAVVKTMSFRVAWLELEMEGGDAFSLADKFLGTSAALGLTVVFLLNKLTRKHNVQAKYLTMNEIYVISIFTAMAMSSVPLAFGQAAKIIATVGLALLWATFIIPTYNLIKYRRICRKLLAERQLATDTCYRSHAFAQDKEFVKAKKADMAASMHYVSACDEGDDRPKWTRVPLTGGRVQYKY